MAKTCLDRAGQAHAEVQGARASAAASAAAAVRAVLRKFGLCRICFRELALKGEIPGVRKASW